MDILLTYVRVFLVGGIVCLLGQILINKTEMTSARILVTFLLLGLALEVIGVFKYLEEFGKTGVTVPIMGFGSALAKGAMKGAKADGILGAIKGGMEAVAAGLTASIFFGFLFALIFKAKTKKY
ncbi:MAG: SpoVA/SpoVAEb family sporulation membrane protein [Christensenellales bacterium]|jgi:stage V sporulation protein AE|nr:SpoVA/SpoVAEb family sporulation membrane protein [Clostridia bacterium]HRU84650.1 SpoVA/SpoVAEb family sporulation membrane protein [Eubacteriales bacterium]